MGCFTYETETASAIPPAKAFKVFVLDADFVIPKAAPQAIKCIELLEGDGGVGSIKKITFGEASKFSYVKQRIDCLDKENYVYCYTILEGDVIGDVVEKIEYEMKVLAGADGGSVLKSTTKYYTKVDVEGLEEKVKMGKEKSLALFKAIESYILANPEAC